VTDDSQQAVRTAHDPVGEHPGEAAAFREVQLLHEIQRALRAAQDTPAVLTALANTLAQSATLLHIDLSSPMTAKLQHAYVNGQMQTLAETLDLHRTTLERAAAQEQALYYEDSATDADPVGQVVGRYRARSHVYLVLRTEKRVTDLIIIAYAKTRRFDLQTRRLFEAFTGQAESAVQNIRLRDQLARESRQFERQLLVLETLNALANSVGAQTDEQELMILSLHTLLEATRADHGGIVLIDPDGQTGHVVSEYPPTGVLGQMIEVATNPVFQLLDQDRTQPLLIEDIETDPRITVPVRELLHQVGTHALVIAPLVMGDRLIGTIGLDIFEEGRRFSVDTVDLVDTLAAQLAVYLQDVRTRQQAVQQTLLAQQSDRMIGRFMELNRVDELLEEAARGLAEMIGAQRVTIRLGTPDAPRREEQPS
jgi:GAF domain-containing protein